VNRTSFRKLLAPSIAVLALSISLTACGASNEAGAESGDTSEAGGLSGDLNGAGASSQEKAGRLGHRLPGHERRERHGQLRPGRLG